MSGFASPFGISLPAIDEARSANALRDLQMQSARSESARQNALRELIATLPQEQRALATIAPEQFVTQRAKVMFPEPLAPKDRFMSVGDSLVDVSGQQPTPVYQGKPKAPEGMRYDDAGQLVAIPGYVEMKSRIAAAGRAPEVQWRTVTLPDGTRVQQSSRGEVKEVPGSAGPYSGNSMDAQDMNILLTGDPSTPQYAAAYARQYETPKFVQGERGLVPIMMPPPQGIRPPAGMGGPQQAATSTPTGPAPMPAPQVGPVVPGTEKSDPDAKKYKARVAVLNNLDSAIEEYEGLLEKYGPSLAAGVGLKSANAKAVEAAHTALAIELKNLFELGALAGPDYELMLKAIADPNSVGSWWTGTEGLKQQLDVVKSLSRRQRNVAAEQYGQGPYAEPAPAQARPEQPTRYRYNPQTGQLETVE